MDYFQSLSTFFEKKYCKTAFHDYEGTIVFLKGEKYVKLTLPYNILFFPEFTTEFIMTDNYGTKFVYTLFGEKKDENKIMLYDPKNLITIYLNKKCFGNWKGEIILGSNLGKINVQREI